MSKGSYYYDKLSEILDEIFNTLSNCRDLRMSGDFTAETLKDSIQILKKNRLALEENVKLAGSFDREEASRLMLFISKNQEDFNVNFIQSLRSTMHGNETEFRTYLILIWRTVNKIQLVLYRDVFGSSLVKANRIIAALTSNSEFDLNYEVLKEL